MDNESHKSDVGDIEPQPVSNVWQQVFAEARSPKAIRSIPADTPNTRKAFSASVNARDIRSPSTAGNPSSSQRQRVTHTSKTGTSKPYSASFNRLYSSTTASSRNRSQSKFSPKPTTSANSGVNKLAHIHKQAKDSAQQQHSRKEIYAQLVAAKEKLDAQIEDEQTSLSESTQLLETAKHKELSLQDQINELHKSTESYRITLAETRNTCAQLQERRERHEQHLTKLETSLDKANAAYQKQAKRVKELPQSIDARVAEREKRNMAELEEYKARGDGFKQKLKELADIRCKLDEEYDRHVERVHEIKRMRHTLELVHAGKIDTLPTEITTSFTQEVRELKKEIAYLTKTYQENQSKIAKTNSDMNVLRNRLASFMTVLEHSDVVNTSTAHFFTKAVPTQSISGSTTVSPSSR